MRIEVLQSHKENHLKRSELRARCAVIEGLIGQGNAGNLHRGIWNLPAPPVHVVPRAGPETPLSHHHVRLGGDRARRDGSPAFHRGHRQGKVGWRQAVPPVHHHVLASQLDGRVGHDTEPRLADHSMDRLIGRGDHR